MSHTNRIEDVVKRLRPKLLPTQHEMDVYERNIIRLLAECEAKERARIVEWAKKQYFATTADGKNVILVNTLVAFLQTHLTTQSEDNQK